MVGLDRLSTVLAALLGSGPSSSLLQGYFAHEKQRPPGTLQREYAKGLIMFIGGGGLFLMSEVPLYSPIR